MGKMPEFFESVLNLYQHESPLLFLSSIIGTTFLGCVRLRKLSYSAKGIIIAVNIYEHIL